MKVLALAALALGGCELYQDDGPCGPAPRCAYVSCDDCAGEVYTCNDITGEWVRDFCDPPVETPDFVGVIEVTDLWLVDRCIDATPPGLTLTVLDTEPRTVTVAPPAYVDRYGFDGEEDVDVWAIVSEVWSDGMRRSLDYAFDTREAGAVYGDAILDGGCSTTVNFTASWHL